MNGHDEEIGGMIIPEIPSYEDLAIPKERKRKNKGWLIPVIILVVCVVVFGVVFVYQHLMRRDQYSKEAYEKLTEYVLEYNSNIDQLKASGAIPEGAEIVADYPITLDLAIGTKKGEYNGILMNGLPEKYGYFITMDEGDEKTQKYLVWTYFGEWDSGHFSGNGIKFYPYFYYFEGNYSGDYEISGVMHSFKQGFTYTGDFKDGEPFGNGMIEYKTGEVFEGIFENLLNAYGNCYNPYDDATYKAYIENGQLRYVK